MIKQLKLEKERSCCGYIQDVEYARRYANPLRPIAVIPDTLYMQVLLPVRKGDAAQQLLPIVVYVVGGGYRTPKVHFRVPWLSRLAERGFVVAMPQYRGTETSTFPAMVEDVRTAVRYMRLHAKEFGGDPQKIILAGGSAGAHAALLAAYAKGKFDADDDNMEISADVCGVIDMYGPVDQREMSDCQGVRTEELVTSASARLMGCYLPDELSKLLIPTVVTEYISHKSAIPPTLIVHGDSDAIVPLSQSELLYSALSAAGKDVEMYCVEGAKHADMKFFQSEMMDIYEGFIQRVTG